MIKKSNRDALAKLYVIIETKLLNLIANSMKQFSHLSAILLSFLPFLVFGQSFSGRSQVIHYQGAPKNYPKIKISSPGTKNFGYRNGIYVTHEEAIQIRGTIESHHPISQMHNRSTAFSY